MCYVVCFCLLQFELVLAMLILLCSGSEHEAETVLYFNTMEQYKSLPLPKLPFALCCHFNAIRVSGDEASTL